MPEKVPEALRNALHSRTELHFNQTNVRSGGLGLVGSPKTDLLNYTISARVECWICVNNRAVPDGCGNSLLTTKSIAEPQYKQYLFLVICGESSYNFSVCALLKLRMWVRIRISESPISWSKNAYHPATLGSRDSAGPAPPCASDGGSSLRYRSSSQASFRASQ